MPLPPTIVVLDDERPQQLAIRATLSCLGRVHTFSNPRDASAFVDTTFTDAAIVDVHLGSGDGSGFDFARKVREKDTNLSILIRTGDDSSELADIAFEVRAFRRIVKSRSSLAELRNVVVEAIAETRRRRDLDSIAASSAAARRRLALTLGSVEEEIATAEGCRAAIQALRNRLTAMSGVAESLAACNTGIHSSQMRELIDENRRLITHAVRDVQSFIDSPFAQAMQMTPSTAFASANAILHELERRLNASASWLVARRRLRLFGMVDDIYLRCGPLRLVTVLRHAIEFVLARSAAGSELRVGAAICDSPEASSSVEGPASVFLDHTRPVPGVPQVAFFVAADVGTLSIQEILAAATQLPDDASVATLGILALAPSTPPVPALLSKSPNGMLTVSLFVPRDTP